jgi:hypothetical protein
MTTLISVSQGLPFLAPFSCYIPPVFFNTSATLISDCIGVYSLQRVLLGHNPDTVHWGKAMFDLLLGTFSRGVTKVTGAPF